MNPKNKNIELLIIILFFALAITERVWFDLGPNIEIITLATMLSAFYLNKKYSLLLIITTLFLSDLLIGNTNIFLFTWSGFLIPAIIIGFLPKLKIAKNKPLVGLFAGLGSNMFFYFWTNFGVWALDSWGMYSKTLQGLITCYINALPFLKNQLTSTMLFVPLGFMVFEVMYKNAGKLMKLFTPMNLVPNSLMQKIK